MNEKVAEKEGEVEYFEVSGFRGRGIANVYANDFNVSEKGHLYFYEGDVVVAVVSKTIWEVVHKPGKADTF